MNEFNECAIKEYKRSGQNKMEESTFLLHQDSTALSNKNTFKLSNNPPRFGESLSITQIQNMNRMAQLQIQNKLTSIFDIFHLKILSKLDHGLSQIKGAQDIHLVVYSHQKTVQQLVSLFVCKIQGFISVTNVKNMGNFMSNLKALSTRCRNQNSKREMLRVNSRMDREYDDFELLDRNNSNDGNSEKTNKMLLKKKEKNEKEISMFKLQMEQLLSQHENYLKKKN